MKIRKGFVSNSSSSSFIIARDYLTPLQIDQIKMHIKTARTLTVSCGYATDSNEWAINDDGKNVKGYTSMDDFDMDEFLREIGVSMDKVEWSNY